VADVTKIRSVLPG